MTRAIICTSCGAKIRASRTRCPRCRAVVQRVDPAAVAAQSRRFAKIAAGMAGAFALGLLALWVTREAEPEPIPVTARPADPLATRRSRPETPGPGGPAEDPVAPAADERPFLDPAGAGALAYQAGDFDGALARFQAALERNPQDVEAMSNLGQVLVKMGRTAEALSHFTKAASIAPERWACQFNLARALGLLGRWNESVEAYREAQRLFPDDYVTTFNLALTLHKKGDEAAAVDQYQKAIILEPNDASFRIALALSYEKLQKTAEAAAAYSEYLRLSPSAPDADKVRARIAQLTASAPGPPPTGVRASPTGL